MGRDPFRLAGVTVVPSTERRSSERVAKRSGLRTQPGSPQRFGQRDSGWSLTVKGEAILAEQRETGVHDDSIEEGASVALYLAEGDIQSFARPVGAMG